MGNCTLSTPGAPTACKQNTVNPIDLGADPSGTNDSTTAIQAALNSSPSRIVYFTCGVYKITSPITAPINAVIKGETNYAWYYSFNDAGDVPLPCVRITPNNGGGGFTSQSGALILGGWTHIESVGMDCAALSLIPCIYTINPFDELIHVYTNHGSYSVYVAYQASPLSQGTRIRDSMLANAANDGVYLSGVADTDITRNDINGCGGYGLNVNAASNNMFNNNILQDCTSGGMRFAGGSNGNAITGNRFNGNYGAGIYFSGVTGANNFTGNDFAENGAAGDLVQGADLRFGNSSNSGCQVFAGNSYANNGSAPNYVAIVNPGGTVSCGSFYERLPSQVVSVFAPTPSAAISTITWLASVATYTTTAAHGLGTSGAMQITISGATPSGYNGTFNCTLTGTSTFTCPIASNPGTETVPGTYQAQFTAAVLQPLWLSVPSDLGNYANDAAAATAGVPVGAEYYDTSGLRRKRLN